MTEQFHPLTTTDCDQICAQVEGLGQGVTYESMRRAYELAVDRCMIWLALEGSDWFEGAEPRMLRATALDMKAAMLKGPQSLKQKMLYALENDEDNDRLLKLINSMEDN